MKLFSFLTLIALPLLGAAAACDKQATGSLSVDGKKEIIFNRKWADKAFSTKIPFSFVYGGRNSSEFLAG